MPFDRLARWPYFRRWFGGRSERAAGRFLQKLGLTILARNVVLPGGELDLIARDHDCIVFVEVRSTEGNDTERPALSVDQFKQKKLTNLALAWLQKHQLLGRQARFDVIAISWPPGQHEPKIEHYVNAFETHGRFQMYS